MAEDSRRAVAPVSVDRDDRDVVIDWTGKRRGVPIVRWPDECDPDDLGVKPDWAGALKLARAGYVRFLAHALRKPQGDVPVDVLHWLSEILTGEAKLPGGKKRMKDPRTRYLLERMVLNCVRFEMIILGRRRDKVARARLIEKWAAIAGCSTESVERYSHLPRARKQRRQF